MGKISKRYLWLLAGIMVAGILFFGWQSMGTITHIEVLGSDYLPKEEILKAIPKKNMKISNIPVDDIIASLKTNPFIESISLETRTIHTLAVQVKVKELVGKIMKNTEFMGYLTSSGSIIRPQKFQILTPPPEISFYTGINPQHIRTLAKQLSIFRFSYEDFFVKIRRINLLSSRNVSIIIDSTVLGGPRKYEMAHSPLVKDLIKISLLDGKYNHGTTVVLGENSVIVKN